MGESIFHWEDESPGTKLHPNRWERMPGSHLSLPELFFVHYPGCGSHFSERYLAFAAKLTKVAISDFFRSHFIFLSISISHSPLPPLLQCTALSVNVWTTMVHKNVILTKIRWIWWIRWIRWRTKSRQVSTDNSILQNKPLELLCSSSSYRQFSIIETFTKRLIKSLPSLSQSFLKINAPPGEHSREKKRDYLEVFSNIGGGGVSSTPKLLFS